MNGNLTFFSSYWEALKDLPEESRHRLIDSIMFYAFEGVEPELSGLERAVFEVMRPNIDASMRSSSSGKKGGRGNKAEAQEEASQTHLDTPFKRGNEKGIDTPLDTPFKRGNENHSDTPFETKGRERIGKDKDMDMDITEGANESRRFVKPTVDEIKAYCEERKNGIDSQAFYDFYEGKGWMIGKNHMKDWRACIRTWERRNKPPEAKSSPTAPEKHKYDYSELERRLQIVNRTPVTVLEGKA